MKFMFLYAVMAAIVLFETEAKLKDGECEVCIKFLSKFDKTLTDADRKDQEKLTSLLKKACKKAVNQDNRFCYYVGGTSDAATFILSEITKPLSYYKPVENICEALKKKDSQICELQYQKELDWKSIDLKKLRVKDLKKILDEWNERCDGCVEKTDFIRKIESVKSKHVEL